MVCDQPRDALRQRIGSPVARALFVLLFSAPVACWEGPTDIIEPEPPVVYVRGRVHVLPGRSLGDVVARVQWDELERGSVIGPNGFFEVGLPREVTGTGILTIEPAEGGDHHPAWVRLDADELFAEAHVVLLPTGWTLTRGTWAGMVVEIDPSSAADARVLPSFWGFIFPFQQDGFLQTVVDSSRWIGQLMTWPDSSFPLPVAIDREGSTNPVSATDSIALWESIDRLEAALGWDAFVPANIADMVLDTAFGGRSVRGAVTVRVDSTQATRGVGGGTPDQATWLWDRDAEDWSGGPVRRVTMFSADIVRARISLRDVGLFSDPRIVPHELMHVLGVGHGCSWPSVQTYCASLEADLPTARDVAHLEVLMAVRRLAAELRTPHGIAAAVFGQRVLSLGLPPVPDPAVLFGPENAPVASAEPDVLLWAPHPVRPD